MKQASLSLISYFYYHDLPRGRNNKGIRQSFSLRRSAFQEVGITIYPAKSFKNGDYFCHCAYVLRLLRNSSFLWLVPAYRDIFSRFKTIRRKQNLSSALGIPKENWGR